MNNRFPPNTVNFSEQKRDKMQSKEIEFSFSKRELDFPFEIKLPDFNKTFYFSYNGKIYWKKCIYKNQDANVVGINGFGKIWISIDEDRYLTAFENLELTDCTARIKNKVA